MQFFLNNVSLSGPVDVFTEQLTHDNSWDLCKGFHFFLTIRKGYNNLSRDNGIIPCFQGTVAPAGGIILSKNFSIRLELIYPYFFSDFYTIPQDQEL